MNERKKKNKTKQNSKTSSSVRSDADTFLKNMLKESREQAKAP